MKENDKITFVLILRNLLESGVPMIYSLSILQNTFTKYSFKISEARKLVNNGYPLFYALQKSGLLSQFESSIIRIGENTENIIFALKKLEELLVKRSNLSRNLITALIYPILFLFVISFIMIIFKNFIVPAFNSLFLDLGLSIPLSFKMLAFLTTIFDIKIFTFLLINSLILWFIIKNLLKVNTKDTFRYIFNIPVLGKIFYNSYVALVLSLWSVSLESGLNHTLTFKILHQETIEPFSSFFLMLHKRATKGDLYEIVNFGNVFKSFYIRQMNIALESGNLPFTLRKLSEMAEIEANTALDTFNRILEPLMSILAGFITALISLSIFSPIINLIRGM